MAEWVSEGFCPIYQDVPYSEIFSFSFQLEHMLCISSTVSSEARIASLWPLHVLHQVVSGNQQEDLSEPDEAGDCPNDAGVLPGWVLQRVNAAKVVVISARGRAGQLLVNDLGRRSLCGEGDGRAARLGEFVATSGGAGTGPRPRGHAPVTGKVDPAALEVSLEDVPHCEERKSSLTSMLIISFFDLISRRALSQF